VAAGGLAVGTHQQREQAAHLVEGPGGGSAEGAAISHLLRARTDVRQMLRSARPPVSNLSAAIPHVTWRRSAVPRSS